MLDDLWFFSGVVVGTSNTLNGGIVDPLEGSGYEGRSIYGKCQANVRNGQVDWVFLVVVEMIKKLSEMLEYRYDGVIMPQWEHTYGASSDHDCYGNLIYCLGGDFSGIAREDDGRNKMLVIC